MPELLPREPMRKSVVLPGIVLLGMLLAVPLTVRAQSRPSPPALCEAAIAAAEQSARLPARLLAAIAITESGRFDAEKGFVRPWPWTINAEGAGQFFASKADAIGAVRVLQARGVRSIDIGCMQVNLYYHPNAFNSLDEAFEPHSNAAYAARFLNSLYASSGDWMRAIGSYHSETPVRGAAYRALVLARWQQPGGMVPPTTPVTYGSFAKSQQVYGAFAGTGRVYGAFTAQMTPSQPSPDPRPIPTARR